jgi:hypothetical protein
MNTTSAIAGVTIERRELPPIPPYRPFVGINQFDTYAVVRCGDVYAQIERFAYWHPGDGGDTAEISFDTRLHGLAGDGAGIAAMQTSDPSELEVVSQVAFHPAMLLEEAHRAAHLNFSSER